MGYALTALQDKLGMTREMLFISTKAGFLQDEVKSQVCHLAHHAFVHHDAHQAVCVVRTTYMQLGYLLGLTRPAMLQTAKQLLGR